ncbi:uncharacterized protein SPPG_00965 [Spizellomyces punctatus DAOM BR117]|uniref:RRM domain-containing protein n=1 Tax=Spizellomyces punctatus (strain DAOM BR117) TaxID=645134 RepID=A0A0L0HPX3_SPIPD|nr:uncharacterized protein SPPG_00965 [Spizellomyces punctatus DAOM BR117]KND03481.1 hypothetical protein SPPG_00965 [Spizellomyces punctatus DAOM BR117]|eukprot:XP_016611520.1 hypothetical protein SPPG_00965 [Spizellomyces punctatus DAOM BR117]
MERDEKTEDAMVISEEADTDTDSSSEEDVDDVDLTDGMGTGPSTDELQTAKKQVEDHPYDYGAHIGYITALRQASDFDALRAARNAMADVFPLSEDLWLEWVQDEARLAATLEEKQAIVDLYDRATKDYLSIKIWHAFITFLFHEYEISLDEDEDESWMDLETVRGFCEQAIKATELHFSQGATVWNAYRDFETALLDRSPDELQVKRVRDMYLKRLRIPHAQLEETFSDYSGFESKYDSEQYEKHLTSANASVAKTRVEVELREPYEKALVDSGQGLAEFLAYVTFETSRPKGGDKFRIRTLYERAISVHCLNPTLWDAYIIDMSNMFQIGVVLIPLAERSVRNCNWAADLWCHYFRIMERFGRTKGDIEAAYTRGLSFISPTSNLEEVVKLMKAFGEYLVRQIDWSAGTPTPGEAGEIITRYKDNIAYIRETFPTGDPYLRLERGLLRFLTHKLKDIQSARSTYADVCKNGGQSDIWLEYAEFERYHGTATYCRAVYKNATLRRTDWPERIFEAWLTFEQEEGTMEMYYEAAGIISKQIKIVEKRRAEEAAKLTDIQYDPGQLPDRKRPREEGADGKDEPDAKRPKAEQAEKANYYDFHVIDNKLAGSILYVTNLSPRTTELDLQNLFAQCGKVVDLILKPNEETGELEAYVEFSKAVEVRKGAALNGTDLNDSQIKVVRCRPAESIWHFADAKEINKIYVSNLPVNVEKKVLRVAFEKYGPLREVRLVQRKTIAFAYIEFRDAESAQRSLELDQKQLVPGSDKKIGVAISDPTKTKLKVADEKELYVTNLPRDIQKEDVEMMFNKFGAVKDVRLPTFNDGTQRGIAFIEFDDERAAKSALSLNGTTVEGRVIVVTIPDPNMRKERQDARRGFHGERAGRGGRGGRGAGRGGRGGGGGWGRGGGWHNQEGHAKGNAHDDIQAPFKPVTSFLPRAAGRGSRAPHRKLGRAHAPAQAETSSGDTANDGTASRGTSKSQDDFRKMLMGGK